MLRSDSDIQDRIRFLLVEELDRRVQESKSRLPHKCQHNHRQPLDVRKRVEGEVNSQYNRVSGVSLPVIGLCLLGVDTPEQWEGTICEDPIDAQRCHFYNPIETRESLQELFHAQIKDLEWVKTNLPEVYGLLWSLGSESMPKLPWWKALWFRLIRIRPDPLVRLPKAKSLETL